MTETFTYKAKSGITVTSCYPEPEPDFKTVLHYLKWSYTSWGKKIWAGIKYNMENGWDLRDDPSWAQISQNVAGAAPRIVCSPWSLWRRASFYCDGVGSLPGKPRYRLGRHPRI